MNLTKKDILEIVASIIGVFAFIYLIVLLMPPIIYYTTQWNQKWELQANK